MTHRSLTWVAAALLGASLSACVVVPVPRHVRGPGVVVVEPGYGHDRPPPPPPRYRDRRDGRY